MGIKPIDPASMLLPFTPGRCSERFRMPWRRMKLIEMKKITPELSCRTFLRSLAQLVVALCSLHPVHAQQPTPTPLPPPTLGLDQGYSEFDTHNFKLKLVKASQTIAALEPKGADGFDFTPADRLERRASNGFHHLGDLILRLRQTP